MYDIAVIGAGPAGSSLVMGLKNSGLKIAIFDKSHFPRDKACGDLVSGVALRTLNDLSPKLRSQLAAFPQKTGIKSTAIYVGNHKPLRFSWVLESYVIRRNDFDQMLLNEALQSGNTTLYAGEKIKKIERLTDGFNLTNAANQVFQAKFVVGCDGANSIVSKLLTGHSIDKNNYGGSVRAYFKGLTNISPNENELYINKSVVPGYFWLFPLTETTANVGIGMHSKHIARDRIDLKSLMFEFIQSDSTLQQKMGNAVMDGELLGYGLPFFSKKRKIHGNGFLLCGDAASLVNPINGEGIMQAIQSGQIAAKTILQAFDANDLSEHFLETYENQILNKWWKKMRFNAQMVKLLADRYYVIDGYARLAPHFDFLIRKVQRSL